MTLKMFRGAVLALLVCGWGVSASAQTIVPTTTVSTANASCTASPTACAIAQDVRGVPSFGVYINVATSGTFNFEALIEESPSEIWFSVSDDVGGAATATADGAFFFSNPGYRKFRVRASAINGAATVRIERGFTGLRSTATLSGAAQGDGAIQDGASAAIEATVRDYANSNPVAVVLTDTGGDPITAVGGGQQYVVDAALGATPTGTLAVAIRDDALSALTPVEGDAIGLRVDANGALWTVLSGAASVTQGGTWTVQPGNTANTTPWLATIAQGGLSATVRDNTGANDSLNVTVTNTDGTPITTFGGGTEVAEDAAHASGVLGGVLMTRRADTAASTANADGDNALLNTDAVGRLWVNCGTGCSGGTQFAEDLAHTTADVGTIALAVRRDSAAAGSGADGDYSTINVDSTGRLWANTEFMDAFAGGDNTANPTTTAVHAMNYVWDGSAWDRASPSLLTEATHDAALTVASTVGTLPVMVAKDFDGSALPNAVSAEGDAQFLSGSLAGVQYVMVVNEDGSATGQLRIWDGTDTALIDGSGNLAVSCSNCSGSGVSVNEDTASADAHPGTPAYTVRQDSLSTTTGADGDYQPLKSAANGRLYTSTTIDAAIPAGTNNIGDVDVLSIAAGNNNIGDVDIASGTITTVSTVTTLSQLGGQAITLNTGNAAAGTMRVVLATDQPAMVGLGIYAEDAAETAGGNLSMAGTVRRDTAATSAGAAGDNATANTDSSGLMWSRLMDPCTALNPTTVPISVAADTAVITAGGGSTRTYICGGGLAATAAEIVSIWEGTGTACGTSSAALVGSTTEANGMSLAVNGGFTIPSTIRGIGTNVDVCIRLSTTNRVAGWLSYVQVAQ